MRSIVDGVIDRDGVSGLARSLAVSERHLHRVLVEEVGAGPLEIARSQRAQTARLLIETTSLTSSDIAFAAGFSSIRQFHETVREVFAASPTELRGGLSKRSRLAASGYGAPGAAPITIRLRARSPFDADGLLAYLAVRSVAGVEIVDRATRSYARTLSLPGGPSSVVATFADDLITATFRLADLADLAVGAARLRRAFDLDSDTTTIDDHLCTDEILAPLIRATPGRRVPGTFDAHEIAVRAVLGQQVSVAGARGTAARLVQSHGERFDTGVEGLSHLFPSAARLAESDPESIPIPKSRGRALVGMCAALAEGTIDLGVGADRVRARQQLVALHGIGPWTADYVLIRALREPDCFLPTDLGVKHAADRVGLPSSPAELIARAQRWRPWRSAALFHLWSVLT